MRGGLALLMTGAVAVAAAPGTAEAGRTFFGWLYPTEVMPERNVELQNWTTEVNRVEDDADRSFSIWGAAPLIGITDQLELALPFEVWWSRVPGMPGVTQLHNYGVEARYRMVTQDPAEAPALAPLVRLGLRRLTRERDTMRPELDIVASYETGRVLATMQIGGVAELTRDDARFGLRAGAGLSVLVTGDLRVGAEAFGIASRSEDAMTPEPEGIVSAEGRSATWVVAGPNLSWTHGRFWVSATYGIGLTGVKTAPRLQWGVAF